MHSLLLKTIRSFPTGRSNRELVALLDSEFDPSKRMQIHAELAQLASAGLIYKNHRGKWKPISAKPKTVQRAPAENASQPDASNDHRIYASYARFTSQSFVSAFDESGEAELTIDPNSLLRYWRSTLRSDPRGGVVQYSDKHGVDWQLITGTGPIFASDDDARVIRLELDGLGGELRQALLKRESEEKTLAVGWPISVGKKQLVPAIWPIGLLAATWKRTETHLEITIENDEILLNPDWIRDQSRATGWPKSTLTETFSSQDRVGLRGQEFILRLREAVAGHSKGILTGADLESELDVLNEGVYNATAIFLPTENTFNAGPIRDLDILSGWPAERLAQTALGTILGLEKEVTDSQKLALPPVDLNNEQLEAVNSACSRDFTVVTGPPGTGKSQTIISMVASVLADGGSVLVASKNHQALDAVEGRLIGIAAGLNFHNRTLDPSREIDVSFSDVVAELVNQNPTTGSLNSALPASLLSKVRERDQFLSSEKKLFDLECELAALHERIEARSQQGEKVSPVLHPSLISRLLAWVRNLLSKRINDCDTAVSLAREGASTRELKAAVDLMREQVRSIQSDVDYVALSKEISSDIQQIFPRILSGVTALSLDEHATIANLSSDWEFSQRKGNPPRALVSLVLKAKPLWLASVLGGPKRMPLQDGMFDLVVFDEASQCDIASSLPLFARAKRAVVVGDNRQLSAIKQLGLVQDRHLMSVQNLPVDTMGRFAQSQNTLFDFAVRVPGSHKVMLKDQYRSNVEIVNYISTAFYGGKLVAAADPSAHQNAGKSKPGMHWTDVPSPRMAELGNVNSREVERIAEHLRFLLMDTEYRGSVGVIAPFVPQVQSLERAIRDAIPEIVLDEVELKVATVDSFQGQERDLILYSPTVYPLIASSAITFFQRDQRRINVAISRARAVVHIFGDLTFAKSGKIKALTTLAAYATDKKTAKFGRDVFESSWERKVYHHLKERGLEPQAQFELAGRRLDFALFGENDVKLDLEIDGRKWHQDQDGNRKAQDHWRDAQIKALGWKVRRFWVDELANDIGECLDIIERDLEKK